MGLSSEHVFLSYKHAYGCFLGLLCGDAAGATLEFHPKKIVQADVDSAMRMPGGGRLNVGRGQITDDSELAISLAFALFRKDVKNGFPFEAVAAAYSDWWSSKPFDVGSTCGRAFSVLADAKTTLAEKMIEVAREGNMMSESNGALMRIAPLAIWCASEDTQTLINYASFDSMLSHPNRVCIDCNVLFCLALVHLFKFPHDYRGAIDAVELHASKHACEKVQRWLFEDSLDISTLQCTSQVGHVRWAFTIAMYCLRKNLHYAEAINLTLLKGGDTDTNAAIVGALIGALNGINDIPDYMKEPVLQFNPQDVHSSGYLRPNAYRAYNVCHLTYHLLFHT